eukprot:g4348.t1
MDIERIERQNKTQDSTQARKRKSILRLSHHRDTLEMQLKYFPKWLRYFFSMLNIGFVIFFISLISIQLSTQPSNSTCSGIFTEEVWKGCKIKIPFCKHTFNPKCNCAYLHIENEKNLTTLPQNMVTEMDGLRHVFVRNCSLTKLPSNMEDLVEMTSFEISFNNLTEFHVNVKRWEMLVKLYLMYNNIKQYNKEAVWTHPNLVSLDLGNNAGMDMPDEINLPLLSYLMLDGNEMKIAIAFSQKQLPALVFLYINGNYLIKFPDESLKSTLLELGISRCRLWSLPPYLSHFSNLIYLDARDNNITSVDADLKKLIHANGVESYFSGNELLCKFEKSLDCDPLCSKYCFSRNAPNNGVCDIECNEEACEYDGGDCKS